MGVPRALAQAARGASSNMVCALLRDRSTTRWKVVRETFGALVGLRASGRPSGGAAAMRDRETDAARGALEDRCVGRADVDDDGANEPRAEQRCSIARGDEREHCDRDIATEIGLPGAELAVALVDEMARTIWA
jgi:hypothetical protein